jgi:hypothetical protein
MVRYYVFMPAEPSPKLAAYSVVASIGRIIVSVIGGILLIVVIVPAGFYVYSRTTDYVHDRNTLPQVNTALSWVEDFYTRANRYPTESEFNAQFPSFHTIGTHSDYYDYNSSAPQSYILYYDLTQTSSNAPGDPETGGGLFGTVYLGVYAAWPCPRWTINGNVQPPQPILLTEQPRGSIFANFATGDVYFAYFNGMYSYGTTTIMTGLVDPRTFQNNNKYYITNGSDVYVYDWDPAHLKLIDPLKVGTVPTGCIENTHHFNP